MSSESYPKRPKFFAYKFVRLMGKVCLANEIGAEACWLLTVIAFTEDASGYRRPVTFFNGPLMQICGMAAEKTLRSARDKAVESGWLNYQYMGTRKPGKYFVTIPASSEGIDDRPMDEGEASITGEKDGNGEEIGCKNVTQSSRNGAPNRDVIGNPIVTSFFPITDSNPVPIHLATEEPSPEEFRTPDRVSGRRKKATPTPAETKKPRERDLLFDAVCEVTASDPKVNGSHVGRVCSLLRKAEPPYTPEEIARFGELAPRELTWLNGRRPTVGELEKYIGRVRSPSTGVPTGSEKLYRRETVDERIRRSTIEAKQQARQKDQHQEPPAIEDSNEQRNDTIEGRFDRDERG